MLDELLLGRKAAQVWTVFTEYHLDCSYTDRVDGCGVHSAHPVESLAHSLFPSRLDRAGFVLILQLRRLLPLALLPLHLRQLPQNLFVVVGNPRLDRIVHLQCLLQAEQMVLPPMPAQLFGDFLLALFAARMAQLRQLSGVSLSLHNRSHDGHSRHAVNVLDRPMHSHIHLVQALLHSPQPVGGCSHQGPSVPDQRAQHADLFRGSKRAHQQPAACVVVVSTCNPRGPTSSAQALGPTRAYSPAGFPTRSAPKPRRARSSTCLLYTSP